MPNINKILAQKGIITETTLGESVLPVGKQEKFVDTIEEQSVILGMARRQDMTNPREDIDRIELNGVVLQPKRDTLNPATDGSEIATHTNKLEAKEFDAVLSISDTTLKKNIERGTLENTVVSLFGSAAGRNFAQLAVFGDTGLASQSTAQEKLYKATDGWIKKAANTVNLVSEVKATDALKKVYKAFPKKYLSIKDKLVFFVDSDLEESLREEYSERQTALGDLTLTANDELKYKGIRVVYEPALEHYIEKTTGTGRVVILTVPNNLVWGIFKETKIETEREAKAHRTDFILTIDGDVHYEDENAVVVGYLEK